MQVPEKKFGILIYETKHGRSRVLALEYLTNVNKWLFLWWESRLLFCGVVENDHGP